MIKVRFKNNKELAKIISTMGEVIKRDFTRNQNSELIKLENNKGRLKISAGNLNTNIEYELDVDDINGDRMAYDYKTFIPIINVLDDVITIENDKISNNKCKYNVKCKEFNKEEFFVPKIENYETINTEEFKKIIEELLPAASKFTSNLNGIYKDGDTFVSCDGNRIFTKKIANIGDEKIFIARELLNEVYKLPFDEEIKISQFGNKIIIQDENLRIYKNIQSMDYVKYKQILPAEYEELAQINGKEFKKAIEMITPVLDGKATEKLGLVFKDNKLKLKYDESNKAELEIPVKQYQECELVYFNIDFLLDVINANKSSDDFVMYKTKKPNMYVFSSGHSMQYVMAIMVK